MKTLLVIDDEYALLDTLRGLLEDEGYRVLAAEDGRSGLEILANHAVDAVLLDVMMPRLGGRAVLDAIRADPKTARTRVCVISAAAPSVLAAMTSADALLRKPFTFAQLSATLGRMLARAT